MTFDKELEALINRYSMERYSNTPDFILAQYLSCCLEAFNLATGQRDKWYGHHNYPGKGAGVPPSEDPMSLR